MSRSTEPDPDLDRLRRLAAAYSPVGDNRELVREMTAQLLAMRRQLDDMTDIIAAIVETADVIPPELPPAGFRRALASAPGGCVHVTVAGRDWLAVTTPGVRVNPVAAWALLTRLARR